MSQQHRFSFAGIFVALFGITGVLTTIWYTAFFSALSFLKPEAIEYEVRLDGFDPVWQRVSEPHAHWPRLPPGEYRFEARARVRPGPWSAPAAMTFEIMPAWWQTTAARVAGVALIALLAFLIYRWRIAILRSRNEELRALVEQRTRELAKANESLLDLSVTDALTGIKNRRYLQFCMPEYTKETLRRHEELLRVGSDPTRSNGDLVCLLIDLDHFKDVNDRHGHLVGDEVLVSLAALLGGLMRESDTLIRWGGEEFLYLARNSSRREARVLAERIRNAVEEHEFHIGTELKLHLTCSIGFAAYPFVPEDPRRVAWEEVVDVTDICLYAAKASGRNCWVGAVAQGGAHAESIVARMRESFRSLVESGEIEVVSSRPGANIASEALKM